MIIGLISDTHISNRASKIPEKVFETFKNVDLNFTCWRCN